MKVKTSSQFFFSIAALRWLDLLLLTITGTLIAIILDDFILNVTTFLKSVYSESGRPKLVMLSMAASTTLFWVISRIGGFRAKDLNPCSALSYPPTWWAGVIATILYVVICRIELLHVNTNAALLLPVSTIIVGPLLLMIINALSVRMRTATHLHNLSPFREKPITTPTEDEYGHSNAARRIATILTNDEFRSIGIIGPYGSGKSSLIHLTKYYLTAPECRSSMNLAPELLTVSVNGWSITGTPAISMILNAMLSSISTRVDTIKYNNLANEYVAIGTSHASVALSEAFRRTAQRTQLELLLAIDDLLYAVNVRLVVVLEDLDRGTTPSAVFDEIGGLLSQLQHMRNITFLLAIGEDTTSGEFVVRLCDHLERCNALTFSAVRAKLSKHRSMLDFRYNDDITLTASEERDKRLGILHTHDINYLLGEEPHGASHDLAELLKYPRLVFRVLSDTSRIFETLHGEVDADELLVVTTLRHAVPEAFAFLNANISSLRRYRDWYRPQNSDGTRLRVERDTGFYTCARLSTAYDLALQNSPHHGVCLRLFHYLLHDELGEVCKQSVRMHGTTDYWQRIVAENLDYGELSDQQVLLAMVLYQSAALGLEHTPILLDRILSEHPWAQKVLQFSTLLRREQVISLTSEYFAALRTKKFSRPTSIESEDGEYHRGFLELYKMLARVDNEDYKLWITHEIEQTLPIDLLLAIDIFYWWCYNNRDSEYGLINPVRQAEIRTVILEQLASMFRNRPENLLSALPDIGSYSIARTINILSDPKHGGHGFDAREWDWLPPILPEAVRLAPRKIIPELAILLVKRQRGRFGSYSWNFDSDFARDLFGDLYRSILRRLSKISSAGFKEEQVIVLLRHAVEAVEVG